jgi:hypothetical protein
VTSSDRILTAFWSRLLAPPLQPYLGQPGGHPQSGGHALPPFGLPPFRSPLLQPTTSTPPTVRDYFAILTRPFTCLLGRLRITRRWAGIQLYWCPLQPDGSIWWQWRGTIVILLLSVAVVSVLVSLVMNYIVIKLVLLDNMWGELYCGKLVLLVMNYIMHLNEYLYILPILEPPQPGRQPKQIVVTKIKPLY